MEESNNNNNQATAKKTLTQEERSKVLSDAAKRRWEKKRKATKAAASKRSHSKRKPAATSRREFSSALKMAEKQLAKSLHDRDEAASRYNLANAQIPSLMRIISALKSPGAGDSLYAAPGLTNSVTIEQIMGDQPLPYANPARQPAAIAPMPAIPIPQAQHPVMTQGRAQGGAIGVALEEPENEDQFLADSPVGGTAGWH